MINWESTYTRLGYKTELEFWTDLYIHKGLSIIELAKKLDVSRNTIRSSLERIHIEIRRPGGPNNQKLLVLDDKLVAETKKDGIAAVAKRLGLSYATVYKRLSRIRGLTVADLHPEDAGRLETSESTDSLPTSVDSSEDDD